MSKIIVGIRGLANKPERDELAEFWKKSITDGLIKNCGKKTAEIQPEDGLLG